jgi:hypothetical protein
MFGNKNYFMKKLALLFIISTTFSYAQSPGEELGKAIYYLLNKDEAKATYLKNVMTQTVSINSASKAFFSGSTREVLKIDLPEGTTNWFYRITTMDINTNYYYPQDETFYSEITEKKTFTINNKTDKSFNFYIIDDDSVNNFRQKGNDNFKYYSKYSKKNTQGFIDSCDLKSDNLWIGLINPNIRDGLKVIVEVVAFGNFK